MQCHWYTMRTPPYLSSCFFNDICEWHIFCSPIGMKYRIQFEFSLLYALLMAGTLSGLFLLLNA